MKKLLPLFILFIWCCESPSKDEAEVSEPKEVVKLEPTSTIYKIRPAGSEVVWVGSKPTGKHNGSIAIEKGLLEVTDQEITGGKIIMDMNDIEVYDLRSDEDSQMKLTEHLRSEDFFDVIQYPHGIFEITAVEKYDTLEKEKYKQKNTAPVEKQINNPSHYITGNLTLKDKTLSIKFPAHIELKDNQIFAKARFIIDRTLWNIKYNEEAKFIDKAQDQLIFNDVVIGLDIVASYEPEII